MNYLTTDTIKKYYPSVSQTQAYEGMSDKYCHVSSLNVIDTLADHGWKPVKIDEAFTRKTEYQGYQRHTIRFRHDLYSAPPALVGDTFLELLGVNSHNGASSYQFHAGIHEKICSNGMVVCDAVLAKLAVRHVGVLERDILDALEHYVLGLPAVIESITDMKEREMSRDERFDFGRRALDIRWPEGPPISTEQILGARRGADNVPTLWKTFNVVQENFFKGKVRYTKQGDDGKVRKLSTRAISSPHVSVDLNKQLWELAEEYRHN